jgi:hypothetical protein
MIRLLKALLKILYTLCINVAPGKSSIKTRPIGLSLPVLQYSPFETLKPREFTVGLCVKKNDCARGNLLY